MNSPERFLAALSGKSPDRTPLAHVAALTTVELQAATGCFMPDVHHQPEQLARLCWANHEILGLDAVSFIINYFGEPAALGCEMDWGASDVLPMYRSHPWRDVDDAVVADDLFQRKAIRSYLETLRIAKRLYGDDVAVLGKVMGPLSMTQVMHGLDRTMLDLIEAPDRIRWFLDASVEVLVRCANAQFDAGADAVAIGEGGAGARMLSAEMYEEVLLGPHQRMVGRIAGATIMHICGDITPRLDALGRIGLKCFNFDSAIRPDVMKRAAAGKFSIMGNVSTGDLLSGAPAQLERQVFDALNAGVDIISPGCAISPKCPAANLLAMRQAIDKWHREGQPRDAARP